MIVAMESDDQRFGEGVPEPTGSGAGVVRANIVLTAVFVVSAIIAAVVFDGFAQVQGVVVAVTLFAVGVFAFLAGYFVAVGRSRTHELSVAELYFLTGTATPREVKRPMLLALTVQVVVALATALSRPNTDGRAGSTLAFGVLVPMLGLGLNGLWSARHGTFGPRRRREALDEQAEDGKEDDTEGADVLPDDGPMD